MSSIQKRPNGRWRARYRDHDGKEHARHFDRKIDAQGWLNTVTASIVRGDYVDPQAGRVTLRSWYEYWSSTKVWTQRTSVQAQYALESTPFLDRELKKITHAEVQGWVKSMTVATEKKPTGLSPATIETRYKFVSMCFIAAVKERVIARNPAEGAQLPRKRRAEASMRIPTPSEVRQLMEAADTYFRAFIAVAAFAGLRLGEVAGLQVPDVDFLRRTITVERQIQGESNSDVQVVAPKDGSERVVYVAEGLTTILAEHLRNFGAWHDETGAAWVFSNGPRQFTRKSAAQRFRTARSRAGLDEFTLHDLRHFYASGLIAQGCDVVTVQRALGHSSPSITLDTYSHIWPSAEDKTRAAGGAVLAEVLGYSADYLRTAAAD
ncbi:site-specific integrase [Brevibacterium sp. R8603A2]|uniref:tyrosine-type recombinase/integrase n=1 Tax=Brevibacterium sp. R8603A2 TaxID=2929779 RepID=UPI001FF9C064|nr:site-specific integrase [Brevibacterium sp. R8603A2]